MVRNEKGLTASYVEDSSEGNAVEQAELRSLVVSSEASDIKEDSDKDCDDGADGDRYCLD